MTAPSVLRVPNAGRLARSRPKSQRARHFWGTEIYNRINRYYRVHRPHHDKSQ